MDLLAIIRRIDTNGDATIDIAEWAEFLRIKEPLMIHPHGYDIKPPAFSFEN
jgi:hypothetical protein